MLAAINRLTPQRGTSLAYGILTSLKAIADCRGRREAAFYSNLTPTPEGEPAPTPTPVPPGTHTSSVIVLLTDGENNTSPDPLEAAQTAADRGVRIYTIGIGSTAGSILHIEGLTIRSRLNEELLQQIAQITEGELLQCRERTGLASDLPQSRIRSWSSSRRRPKSLRCLQALAS